MANIQQLLNEEIRRLARKEVITVEKELKAQLSEMRKTISELKSKIKVLEKANAAAAPAPAAETADNSQLGTAKTLRITAERITAWRKKLGLNCAQYAKLLDVSPLSVCHWENGKTTPREAQKKRIAELRDMGKRELKKLCEEKGIKLRKAK